MFLHVGPTEFNFYNLKVNMVFSINFLLKTITYKTNLVSGMFEDTCAVEAGVTTEVHLASGLSLKFKTNKLCSQRLFVY